MYQIYHCIILSCITIKDHTASHGAGLPLSDCVQAGPQHGRGQEGSGAGLPGMAVSTKLGPEKEEKISRDKSSRIHEGEVSDDC